MTDHHISYGTISSNGTYGLHLNPPTQQVPNTPAGLLVTRAVETKAGWVGQVIIDKDIVWESAAFDERDAAVSEANGLVVDRLKALFA